MDKAYEFLMNEVQIKYGDAVVVAVSGGPDSMALLHLVASLKKLGFKHDGFITNYDYTKQVRWSFELPLLNKSEEDILKEMNGNTRRAIKKAEHLQVKIRELTREELPLFKEIMDHTSERRDFTDKSLEYYIKMYDLFHDKKEIKYMIAEVNLTDTLEVLNNDLKK